MVMFRDEVFAAYAALDAAVEVIRDLDHCGLSAADRITLQVRLEASLRKTPTISQRVLAGLIADTDPKSVGAKSWAEALKIAVRLSGKEATRRVREAETLGPRRAVTGQPLAPLLEHTSSAQAQGRIGPEHVRVITAFVDALPGWVDIGTRVEAERQLAGLAAGLDPDQLRRTAGALLERIDPDGAQPDEAQRARKRGLVLGPQQRDGMSRLTGWVTPEGRAYLEPILAKGAAPGQNNPGAEQPAADNTEQPAAEPPAGEPPRCTDTRTVAQRNHDAVLAMARTLLESDSLGTHNGLPVTVIVTTTLQELHNGAGHARTAGDTTLPMRDLIRMAAHSYHYLAVFDQHTNQALYLGRAKRFASAAQRIMLLAREGGCTRPGCWVPGYWTQVHHAAADWNDNGQTNIDELTLACGPDNRAATTGGWTTRKRRDGRTEWRPPPILDTGQQRINNYHQPWRNLLPDDEAESDGEGS